MALFDDRLIEMLRKKTEEVKAKGIKEKEYECNICKDKGIIAKEGEDGYSYARDCSCKRTRRWKKKNESNGMSTRLDTNSFDTFIADDKSLKNAKEKAMRYSKNWEGKSFLLCGSVGSGKTHLALAIINEVAKGEINSNSVYQVLPDIVFYSHMIGQLKSSMSFSNNQDTTKILNSYKNSPFLMIDDFLKLERSTTVLAWLFDIINHRYMNKLPTVITTELTTTQLMGVDEALASRIIEMCGANNIAIIESTNKRNPNLTGYLQE